MKKSYYQLVRFPEFGPYDEISVVEIRVPDSIYEDDVSKAISDAVSSATTGDRFDRVRRVYDAASWALGGTWRFVEMLSWTLELEEEDNVDED